MVLNLEKKKTKIKIQKKAGGTEQVRGQNDKKKIKNVQNSAKSS